MKYGPLLAGAASCIALAGCAMPRDEASFGLAAPAGVAQPEVQSGGAPVPEVVIARMRKSLRSSPVLRVAVTDRHRGVDYECVGWMAKGKTRSETRRNGELLFAMYHDARRVQEFMPRAKFVNGTEAENALLEYDYDKAAGGWPRLLDFDFACGPGTIVADNYVEDPFPEMYLGNMESAAMTEVSLRDKSCYWYHMEDDAGTTTLTWDLYVDRESWEPVRLSRLFVSKSTGKATKDDVYDFTFTHLPSESGVQWALEAAKLANP